MIANVLRLTRSPMNPLRWCVDLECGHETWVTQKSRPKVTFMVCSTCADRALAAEGEARRGQPKKTKSRKPK